MKLLALSLRHTLNHVVRSTYRELSPPHSIVPALGHGRLPLLSAFTCHGYASQSARTKLAFERYEAAANSKVLSPRRLDVAHSLIHLAHSHNGSLTRARTHLLNRSLTHSPWQGGPPPPSAPPGGAAQRAAAPAAAAAPAQPPPPGAEPPRAAHSAQIRTTTATATTTTTPATTTTTMMTTMTVTTVTTMPKTTTTTTEAAKVCGLAKRRICWLGVVGNEIGEHTHSLTHTHITHLHTHTTQTHTYTYKHTHAHTHKILQSASKKVAGAPWAPLAEAQHC
jgi:hypothetical protein